MRRLLSLLIVVAVAAAAAPAAAQEPSAIGAADVQPHLQALQRIADANGGNRASGLPGGAATAGYIADQLTALGWNVQRQPFAFPYYEHRTRPVLGDLRFGRDFTLLRYSAGASGAGRLRMLLGGSCSARRLRVVRPGDVVFMPEVLCTGRMTATRIKREGGIALVTVGDYEPYPLTPASFSPDVPVPVFFTSLGAARRLERRYLRGRKVPVRVDPVLEQRTVENVIAELPGMKPERVLMAGGHLDGVPEGPGLNDNGSGIAGLLEIAERLSAPPRRDGTVRLGFWAGEEFGLFGSRHYVRTLPRPELRRITGYVNLDMIGSPNAVPEVYAGRNPLARGLRRHIPGAGTTPVDASSDHEAFNRAGITVSGVYTGGLELKSGRQAQRWKGRAGFERDPCYHRRCDGLRNVDAAMTGRVATATARVLYEQTR